MIYETCFPDTAPDPEGLRALGFTPSGNEFKLEKSAKTAGFRMTYRIFGRSCEVTVTDSDSGWEYDLFNVPSSSGATVTALREETDDFLRDVNALCFHRVRQAREAVLDYCKKTYGTVADCPFEGEFASAQVLRKPSGKWYGLMMTVPADRLDKRFRGDAELLNLKAKPERIAAADGISVFPAWHMNKKCWLTVRLDSPVDPDLLHALIDESYALVK